MVEDVGKVTVQREDEIHRRSGHLLEPDRANARRYTSR
jgi:hypothetical protein